MESGKSKHLLIVEDSADLQMLLTILLKKEGYTLSKASNGQEALDLLRSSPELPALILLDVMMPVMDGFAFRQAQRSDPRLAGIPVVVMTADANPKAKAAEMQVTDFIRKPIDIDQLLEVTGRLSA